MPREDADRWNERYLTAQQNWQASPRSILTQHQDLLKKGGLALDVAMGLGANSAFLISHGWRVIGVDISQVAVFQAKSDFPSIQAVIADLTRFQIPPDRFDLILNLYYLDRALWPVYRRAVKPGGLVIIETLQREMSAVHPDAPPHFLLEPGELRAAFQNWKILHDQEGWAASDHGKEKCVASLIARRP
jgi:tellurite methyltransferase